MLSDLNELNQLNIKIMKCRQGKETPLEYIERTMDMGEIFSKRGLIQIEECGQGLRKISHPSILFCDPHPYQAAGSPYGGSSPFFLREEVADRLEAAAQDLSERKPDYKLLIFDGYRPLDVQVYMRDFEFKKHASDKGWDTNQLSIEQTAELWRLVDLVWAQPNKNPAMPPPHATGAAVDLTIVQVINEMVLPLNMGTAFDEPSEKILPSYFYGKQGLEAAEINGNRALLERVMSAAGFMRNTHEWWHFSYGDQLWALFNNLGDIEIGQNAVKAKYGFADPALR